MAELPAKWEFEIYSKLWVAFKQERFSNLDAKRVVDHNNLNQALSKLRKKGWLTVQRDQRDARKSYYVLNDPGNVIIQAIENGVS